MAELFDSHAHYDDRRFLDTEEVPDRDALIKSIFDAGDGLILNAASDIASSHAGIELSEKYDRFYSAAGIHPHEIPSSGGMNDTLDTLKKLLLKDKVKALGEIGLDYHYDGDYKDEQKKWFRAQMELACELDMPVIIHDREAHGDCMEIIREFPGVRGILHSFSGSVEMAHELLKRGWYISFSGVITFKNASRILDVVKCIPEDRILIETDCPYLAPVPMRGKLNHSGYLKYTAMIAAQVRSEDYDAFCERTFRNTAQIYGIDIG